jgi:outer membrane protein assembly factor BamB
MKRPSLPAVALALALAGCGGMKDRLVDYLSDDDTALPPSPLVEFQPTIAVEELWSIGIGGGTDKRFLKLAPVVEDGRIFAAERGGHVYAIAPDTGERIWEQDIDALVTGGPGVGAGRVLLGTSEGEVAALSADNGRKLWRVRVSSEVLAPPRGSADTVVVRTGDGKLFGLSASNGAQLWIYDRTVPNLSLRGTSAPAISEDLVIAGFDSGRVVALELRSGRLVWESEVSVARGRSDLERMVDIDADPLIVDDTVYVATFQGNVAALSRIDGNIQWAREISSFAGLTADARYLYVTDEESSVWALDRETGASIWKQEALKYRLATAPARVGEQVVVGDMEGYLHWMQRSDGGFSHRLRLDDERIIAQPIVVEGILIAYGSSGELAAFRPQ